MIKRSRQPEGCLSISAVINIQANLTVFFLKSCDSCKVPCFHICCVHFNFTYIGRTYDILFRFYISGLQLIDRCRNSFSSQQISCIIAFKCIIYIYSTLQQNIHKCLYKFQITASNFLTIRKYAFKSFPCSLKFLRRIFCIFCYSAEYT